MSNLLYAPAIHQAAAGGDLEEMKKLAEHAEEHLEEHGDIRSALALLQVEIARLEKKGNQ
jgi:hypothetical protein